MMINEMTRKERPPPLSIVSVSGGGDEVSSTVVKLSVVVDLDKGSSLWEDGHRERHWL